MCNLCVPVLHYRGACGFGYPGGAPGREMKALATDYHDPALFGDD